MFNIYDENRKKIDLPQGVIPLDIFVSSISRQRQTNQIEGRFGSVNYGVVDEYRTVDLYILLRSHDTADYRLLRDELYELFGRDFLYVEETRVRGKLYKISVDSSYIPDRAPKHARDASVMIPGVTIDMPYAESIGTTADITGNVLKYSDELWSYGMGLLYDEESHKYIHAGKSFKIYNAGSVEVHPFEQYLKITIANATKGYKLTNTTTGDVFEYTGTASGRIVLDGPNVTVNSLQALRDTNRKFLTLAPGWNTFTQNQAREVKFDTRFYYK